MGGFERSLAWLELVLLEGVTRARKREAVLARGGPELALSVLGSRSGAQAGGEALRDGAQRLRALGAVVHGLTDPEYPALLREIPDPPLALFLRGRIDALGRPSLAIVGTRAATRRGRLLARQFAAGVASLGFGVVSGLARGIDTGAHVGAVEEEGGTVAVLGTGLDVIVPVENEGLAERIAERGCLVSEFPPGHPPRKYGFYSRNRIVSGLCRAVLVVEGGVRSGALITARWAAEQGRDVLAVPGPVEHPLSKGPHALIREGAILVETTGDVVRELGWCLEAPPRRKVPERGESAERRVLIGALELVPLHVEELARRTGVPVRDLSRTLLELELEGRVCASGGGFYSLPG